MDLELLHLSLSMMGSARLNRCAKMIQVVGFTVLSLGSLRSSWAQSTAKAPRSVSQIQEDLRRHPDSPKLYVALGLAFWDRNDYAHALEAFQYAVNVGPASSEAHNWLGVATMQKGDFPGAIVEFKKAISLNPKYARAYTNLGSALAKNGDLAEAIASFQKALSLEPSNAAAQLNLGIALREKGDANGALVHLQLVARREPNNANAQYLLGQTLQQSGNLGAAIKTFEYLLRIDPEFREGYYALGVALKQQAASLRKPRPLSPSPADDLFKSGQQAAARGELKEAEQFLLEAIDKDGNHAEAENLLGFTLGQQGKLPSALTHLERAVALRPSLADAHYNLGVALWYTASRTRSLSELKQALRLDPGTGPVYAFLGTALREMGELDDARRNLQCAIALLPSFSATYIDLGITYLRGGNIDKAIGQFEAGLHVPVPSGPAPDWDAAIVDLRKALAANSDSAEAHNVLGLLLGRKGADGKEVLAEFREAVHLQPDFAEAHNNLGLVLAQSNDEKAAIAEFREALRISPDYADAHANLGAVFTTTDGDEAVRELEKAVALAPGSLKAQFNLAVAYGENPSYGLAKEIEELRKVIASQSDFPGARLGLGRALLSEGKVEESIEELREAVRLDPQNTQAHYQMGLALARAGHHQGEASAELQKSRELALSDDRKQNAALDIAEGHVALERGELDQAAAKFRHAIELQPDSADAQHLLGTVLEKQGDRESAAAAYRRALELNPGDLVARDKIATLSNVGGVADDPGRVSLFEGYIREARFQEVEPLLAAYVKERPKSSWGWYALGFSQFAQKKIGQSIQALAKSLQLDIRNAEAHKILGRDLMVVGRFEAAQTEFEQGILYDPQSAEMHFNLGKLFSIQDSWLGARKELEKAVQLDPSYLEAWDALGFAQEALGDGAGAVASYEKAIALNEVKKGNFVSAHVNLSAYYNRMGDYEKALAYAHAALQLDPKTDGAWFQQAKADEALGRLNDAASALNKAVALDPRASTYYYVLANVYRKLGKAEDSRKALDTFLRLQKETSEIEEKRRSLADRPASPPKSQGASSNY
jgi:tetratricopeptide (TPR) repeat protein